jgi:glycosyltransferase involved in cell wall biosynthesis
MSEPLISVVVPSFNARATIGGTLDSLLRQETDVPYEVIVVDSSQDDTSAFVARHYPQVRLFHFADRKFPGDARNHGARKARGAILAFTDADCVVDPNFIGEISEAHKIAHPLIGGVIDNANPESYVGWAHYFAECSQWMPQTEAMAMIEIPTACLSVKRWAFDRYGPFLEGTYCSDTAFQWRARSAGEVAWLRPAIRVAHTNICRFGRLVRKQAFHGRSFARVRVGQQNFTVPRRLFYALLSPLLPFLLFARTARRVFSKGVYRREFLKASPLVFCCLAAWSWGELIGYVAGTRSGNNTQAPREQ